MIRKFRTIDNLAVFQEFEWDKEVCDKDGNALDFKSINVIYGRNYSGKTTLSRIVRGMETGVLSDKYEFPSFSVSLADGSEVTQSSLTQHGKKIRVFNEDFVRENIRFIIDPDGSIEPFAIFGEDNNKIEQEIEALEKEIGSNEDGKEAALYAKLIEAREEYKKAKGEHKKADDSLNKQLSDKATDRQIGVKYKADRFGDQNYNIQKLKNDIDNVLSENYASPTDTQLAQYERLIAEKTLQPASEFHSPSLHLEAFIKEVELLVGRKISESNKIDDLVKDAILNRWVSEGRAHHKGKRDNCAFCGNHITEDRWGKLEKHFDEESSKLEQDIDALIQKIEGEKKSITSALLINKSQFYSAFHERLDAVSEDLKKSIDGYSTSLDSLVSQLKTRKDDLLVPQAFQQPKDASIALESAWRDYEVIRSESEEFTGSLSAKQSEAKTALRLDEISRYLITIGYQAQVSDIDQKKTALDEAEQNSKYIRGEISQKEDLIAEKKRQLNDEEKGAIKVNEYLNNFFGHQFLSLEAIDDPASEESGGKIKFEVKRDGKKAYHLSEGECSLLAFCYFLAKLDDIDTKDTKPIIWIDDPISSLDSNHVFFVYSLINQEVVSKKSYSQLFISTHNLDFLKYLKRLPGSFRDERKREDKKSYRHLVVERSHNYSSIKIMPSYLREYVTEFNYLFHQIHKCAQINTVDDSNFENFYNFGNNARKFLEIYLYYRYPDQGMTEETLTRFFGDERIPAVLTDRINNEYSHLSGVFERGATPVEVPEMLTSARQIIERLKQDGDQFSALLKSIGEATEAEAQA
ncbi:AAA family ATPase [Microbulbifer sp.]|uniref:AAA family ATPase n=1 Tax=Microbulbifer sp. TaxID=1908541 RepID=UPI003F351A38